MTRVPVTYQIEERDTDGVVLQTWMRGQIGRADALRLFDALWRGDEQVGWQMYRPGGGRRLVMVATPASSARLNPAAVEDLRAAVPPAVAARVLAEADQYDERLTLAGAR